MEAIVKRLVFSFYLEEGTIDNKINKLHFACLFYYAHIFDEINVTIIKEKGVTDETLLLAKHRFIDLNPNAKITINTIDNNALRESVVFKNEVVDKLDDNVLVFFGHNKGVSNISVHDEDVIFTWVSAMYFYNLNFIDEVVDCLLNKKYYSYGAFLTKNDEQERCNKYGWYYIGTFFWINSGKLNTYIKNFDIKLPELSDRFYDEEFLGNIIPTWPLIFTASHENRYIQNATNYYKYAKEYLNEIYPYREDYNRFFNNIMQ